MSNGYTHKKTHFKGKYEYCFHVNYPPSVWISVMCVVVFTCVMALGCTVRMLAALLVALLEGWVDGGMTGWRDRLQKEWMDGMRGQGLVYLVSRARRSRRGGEVDLFSVRLLPAFTGH